MTASLAAHLLDAHDAEDALDLHTVILANARRRFARAAATTAHRDARHAAVTALVCRVCRDSKPVDDFPLDRSKATGRRATCRACRRA